MVFSAVLCQFKTLLKVQMSSYDKASGYSICISLLNIHISSPYEAWFCRHWHASPFATEGWCGEKLAGLHDHGPGDAANVYTTFIGYDIWMYMAYILIPTLSLATHLYIRSEVS